MKYKILSIVLLTLALALTLVSAQVSVSTSTPTVFSKTNTGSTFRVTNNGLETVNVEITIPSTIDDGNGHILSVSSQSPLVYNNIAAAQVTSIINLIYSGDTTNFKTGQTSSNIIVKATSVTNSSDFIVQTVPLGFVNDFCKYGQNGTSLSLSSISIKNDDGDDTEWKPLDNIRLKVQVENNGDSKMTGVYAEIGLIDSKGKNIVGDLVGLSDKKNDIGTINDGSSKTVEFDFQVPSDFKDETYLLVVKAYKSGKEAANCTSYSSDLGSGYYQEITGTRQTEEKKQVVVTNIITSPETTASCGDKVQISADVANIGDQDYSDQIKVTLVNSELKLDLEKIINGDFNQGDSDTVDFAFDVPTNAAEKTYNLQFKTYYDYSSGDTYRLTSQQTFTQPITIKGNCVVVENKPSLQITAELDPETPEAIAGKQVIVKSTLKNNGNTDSTYSVSVYGNSAWSSLVSVQPESLTLKAGESKQVSIVLNVDSEAVGDKEFTIKAAPTSGTSSVEQNVALTVTKQSLQFSAITDHFKKNWFIYLIVIINLVLIIAIIIVIKKMVSPRKRRDFE